MTTGELVHEQVLYLDCAQCMWVGWTDVWFPNLTEPGSAYCPNDHEIEVLQNDW